ncbi:MAG TPA: S8 family serine peptidase [Candidatus Limnocylindrales bacterium]|nr:S8 family serine peptidase [Candidatus Limnocylindrales bacterium]
MHRKRMSAALAVAGVALLTGTAVAGNPYRNSTTTAGGNETWDSDQINVENVSETGAGVYVAVLDTGLVPEWQDYFPDARVAQELGKGFYQAVNFKAKNSDPCGVSIELGALRQVSYIGSRTSAHGTHVASTIIGYNYRSNTDAAQGYPLPAIQVRGIAPDATIIPVRVLADYQVPALPKCDDPAVEQQTSINFGTDGMVSAGIDYVTSLARGALAGKRIVINMSLGDTVKSDQIEAAINRAIAAGVVVVASAGNEGEAGMGWPGAYPQVISAAASGWTGEWLDDGASGNPPSNGVRYRMFWLQDTNGGLTPPLKPNSGDVAENGAADAYITDFSSREKAGQDLDVAAPGSWVRGPFASDPGYNHLPYWSKGIADLLSNNQGNFFYVGGTSMASPHVAATAALMLEKNHGLGQSQIESILESSAAPMGAGSAQVWDPFHVDADGNADPSFVTMSWGTDATGAGLLQADAAIAATP